MGGVVVTVQLGGHCSPQYSTAACLSDRLPHRCADYGAQHHAVIDEWPQSSGTPDLGERERGRAPQPSTLTPPGGALPGSITEMWLTLVIYLYYNILHIIMTIA